MEPKLRAQFISIHHTPEDALKDYEAVYAAWKAEWTAALADLNSSSKLRGEDFTRNDEVLAIFDEANSVVAFVLLKWMDLRKASDRETSTFSAFPSDVFGTLIAMKRPRVMQASYFAIAAAWRKRVTKIQLADTVFSLLVKRTSQTQADVLVCATRRDRGISSLLMNFGSTPLAEGQMHGVAVDLLMTKTEDALSCSPKNPALVEMLWVPLFESGTGKAYPRDRRERTERRRS